MNLTRVRDQALHGSGIFALLRWLNRKGISIVTYHRFNGRDSATNWKRQCAYFRERCHPVSLSEASARLRNGRQQSPYQVVITVDDGYRDFYEVAYPIAREYGIPVTIYVVSDFLDNKDWLWWDKVDRAARETTRRTVEVDLGGKSFLWEAALTQKLRQQMKVLPDGERRRILAQLPALFDVSIPETAPEGYEPLRWEEVREMTQHGIEFGAHTRSHPILKHVEAEDALRFEIEGSKARIEQELQREAPHFSYPNGDWDSRVVEQVRRAGFSTAVTTRRGLNYAGDDPLLLKRMDVDVGLEDRYFRRKVAGVTRDRN